MSPNKNQETVNNLVGKHYPVWWKTDKVDLEHGNIARILKVEEYTGLYKESFTHVLTLSDTNTRRGYTEMSVDLNKYIGSIDDVWQK